MRLDLFLKNCHIRKRRNEAKRKICQKEVWVNGQVAKPATNLREGDIIEIEFEKMVLKLKVLKLAERPIKKSEQEKYIEILEKKEKELF